MPCNDKCRASADFKSNKDKEGNLINEAVIQMVVKERANDGNVTLSSPL